MATTVFDNPNEFFIMPSVQGLQSKLGEIIEVTKTNQVILYSSISLVILCFLFLLLIILWKRKKKKK